MHNAYIDIDLSLTNTRPYSIQQMARDWAREMAVRPQHSLSNPSWSQGPWELGQGQLGRLRGETIQQMGHQSAPELPQFEGQADQERHWERCEEPCQSSSRLLVWDCWWGQWCLQQRPRLDLWYVSTCTTTLFRAPFTDSLRAAGPSRNSSHSLTTMAFQTQLLALVIHSSKPSAPTISPLQTRPVRPSAIQATGSTHPGLSRT